MITTHVLDTAQGRPGKGIAIELERADQGVWNLIGAGITDDDGRLKTLTQPGTLIAARYRIRFQTGLYFEGLGLGLATFFPVVEIQFTVADGTQHFHVPLLLSPYGYSTYRGS